VAAILRYLYLKTAKMQHKSAKKSVICINRLKYFQTALTDFSLKLIDVTIIILFDVPASFRLNKHFVYQIRRLNLGQVSVVINFQRATVLFVFPGLFLGYSRAINIYTHCACVLSCIYNSFSYFFY